MRAVTFLIFLPLQAMYLIADGFYNGRPSLDDLSVSEWAMSLGAWALLIAGVVWNLP